ncbi:MAG: transposase [Acidobacteriota bacterium]
MKNDGQLELEFPTWGGKREGAGRKPAGDAAGLPHTALALHSPSQPVHVTMKVRADYPMLRTARLLPIIERHLAAGRERFGFRLVHYSIQPNHLHIIAEAESERSLARGVKGIAVRISRGLNRALGLTGTVFPERHHARSLGSPREVRNALRYVLNNDSKHAAESGQRIVPAMDICSSARYFTGWREDKAPAPLTDAAPVVPPRTWLLREGWLLRHGPIGLGEVRQSLARGPRP